jgi:AraC-like DNA-binding protein
MTHDDRPISRAPSTSRASPDLAAELLDALATFRAEGANGVEAHAPGLFSYCALRRERLAQVRLERPLLGVLLSGVKEVWRGDEHERFSPGTLFVLPAGLDLDIVNEPNARGTYQSLIMEIAPDDTPDLGPGPDWAGSHQVTLTTARVEAVVHAARAIIAGPAGEAVRAGRMAELLALLHDAPAAQPLFDVSTRERAARTLRGALDADWTADRLARRLAMSESTLRRRLAGEGACFSAILRRERMEAARRLIAKGMTAQAAAGAVGYASRAHFARAFRAQFGANPVRG